MQAHIHSQDTPLLKTILTTKVTTRCPINIKHPATDAKIQYILSLGSGQISETSREQ